MPLNNETKPKGACRRMIATLIVLQTIRFCIVFILLLDIREIS